MVCFGIPSLRFVRNAVRHPKGKGNDKDRTVFFGDSLVCFGIPLLHSVRNVVRHPKGKGNDKTRNIVILSGSEESKNPR